VRSSCSINPLDLALGPGLLRQGVRAVPRGHRFQACRRAVRPRDRAHAYTRGIAERLAATAPDRYITTAMLEARSGRLFIDYLRNGRGTTAVGAYSPRARHGFPVAAVTWPQVEHGLRSDAFSIRTPPRASEPMCKKWFRTSGEAVRWLKEQALVRYPRIEFPPERNRIEVDAGGYSTIFARARLAARSSGFGTVFLRLAWWAKESREWSLKTVGDAVEWLKETACPDCLWLKNTRYSGIPFGVQELSPARIRCSLANAALRRICGLRCHRPSRRRRTATHSPSGRLTAPGGRSSLAPIGSPSAPGRWGADPREGARC
jgi:hypothetical protein